MYELLKRLHHRSPFQMIDRIVEILFKKKAMSIRNTTILAKVRVQARGHKELIDKDTLILAKREISEKGFTKINQVGRKSLRGNYNKN
ncbi:MAG: hypothetical protein ACUVQ9_13010 [Thermodesulfobacteriota bacterium]